MKIFITILFIFYFSVTNISASSYSQVKYIAKFIKNSKTLSSTKIKELTKMIERAGDTKKVGKILG